MSGIDSTDISALKGYISSIRKLYIKLYKDWRRFFLFILVLIMVSFVVSPFKDELLMSIMAIVDFILLIIIASKVARLGKKVKELYAIYLKSIDEYNYYNIIKELLDCVRSAKYSGDLELRDLYKSIEEKYKWSASGWENTER